MKKRPYQSGDRIRILRPRIIKRVGYPLHFRELREEARQLLNALPPQALGVTSYRQDLVDALAKELVAARRFGGSTRSLHYYSISEEKAADLSNNMWADLIAHEEDDWSVPRLDPTGLECSVIDKYVRYTGEHFGPSYGGYDSDDFEPGGLANSKAQVILKTRYGDFEECDVELVKPSA
jgi:hypothetical protein